MTLRQIRYGVRLNLDAQVPERERYCWQVLIINQSAQIREQKSNLLTLLKADNHSDPLDYQIGDGKGIKAVVFSFTSDKKDLTLAEKREIYGGEFFKERGMNTPKSEEGWILYLENNVL